jgi:diadenosine tetraphosphate (Ap4A) HIT family hydrolase
MTASDCPTCTMVSSLEDDAIAYRDDTWTVGLAVEVPGWLMLASNNHIEGAEGLDDSEASSFGRLAARLARALKDVCEAERVYLMYQGEHSAHFHVLTMARRPDVPADWRGMALLAHRDELTDGVEARRVVAEVRQRLTP